MYTARFKKWLASMLMLCVVGQAVASISGPCTDYRDAAASMSAAVDTGHEHHHDAESHLGMVTTNVDSSHAGHGDASCCSDGSCLHGTCVTALVAHNSLAVAAYGTVHELTYSTSPQSSVIATLFRPPISR